MNEELYTEHNTRFFLKALERCRKQTRAEIDKFLMAIEELKDSDGEHIFPTLRPFAIGCLSLPHANADCERVSSCVKRIKNKDRNKLNAATVRDTSLTRELVHKEKKRDELYKLAGNKANVI